MKKIWIGLLCLITVLAVSSLTLAALPDFSGRWANMDANTRGVTTLDIQVSGNNVTVEAWGKASPSDIDWGRVNATAFAPNVSSNLGTTAHTLLAIYENNFSKRYMIIRAVGTGRLSAEILTVFTDNSNRSSYIESSTFTRSSGSATSSGNTTNGNTANSGSLGVPNQTAPANGTQFNNYPRTTVLQWEAVPGASSYGVEVDYYTANTKSWMTDQGRKYIDVSNLRTTQYRFNFVGAQPGRWRVWAVGANGETGPKSGWWEFSYTR